MTSQKALILLDGRRPMHEENDVPSEPVGNCIELTVGDKAGTRLDQWLGGRLADRSRSEIQRWIREARVQVDGAPAKASLKVEIGQRIAVDAPPPAADAGLTPEPIPLTIVYEDTDLLVVDKPAGMVVHPAPGHAGGTLVNAVMHHCPDIEGVGGVQRPGIVHRLDKDTSGLIVVAKHDRAQRALQAQFKQRTVYKEYLALLEGKVEPPAGRILAPLGRHPAARKRQAVLPPDPTTGEQRGRTAETEYHTTARYALRLPGTGVRHFTLARVVLHTGRTHQIRVHFAWRGHAVVGDTLYGYKRPTLPLTRHFLHAGRLRLHHPTHDEILDFTAPLPPDLNAILTQLEEQHG